MAADSAYLLFWAGNYWKDSAVVIQLKPMNIHSKTAICGTWVVRSHLAFIVCIKK